MKSKAIFINAYNRPRYLRVCLDALSHCLGLSDWDIVISFDGGSSADFSICRSVLKHYEVVHPHNLKARDHPTEILRSALEFGYKKILYCDEDALLRTDALAYANAQPDRNGFISLQCVPGHPQLPFYLSSSPVVMYAPLLQELLSFMDAKRYLGMKHAFLPGVILGQENTIMAHDLCWCALSIAKPILNYYADLQYSLNFGFTGYNWRYAELEAKAFSGQPGSWFDNILCLASQEAIASKMGTPGFNYE